MRPLAWLGLLGILLSLLTACGAPPEAGEELGEVEQAVVSAPLPSAHCQINVIGKGVKALEDDYLPHVITCENGGASLEALKAQAIAARSVAYYNIATQGSICDGQGCQVYSCGAAPQAKHFQAVKETAGMYLSFAGALTYGFYVAGDTNTGGSGCVGSSGSTEKYVTYNWGKTGGAVKQTSLGYIGPPGFGQNRGCMGQWGARCLESKGWGHMDILRFYYGSDIQVLKASGPCVQSCKAHCEGSTIVGADCGKGDCAAYGATCVDDSKGVRCASVFCPAQGQKKVCIDDKLIGDCNDGAISSGDCSVYGAKCVDDAKGARCVSVFCPAQGQKKVCIDDKIIGDCDDGGISTGDCSVYAAKCVDDAKGARCASLFCDGAPGKAHDVCLPNGQLGHCTDAGGLSAEDCPADEPCTDTAAGAQCGETPPTTSSGGTGGSAPTSGGASGAGGAAPSPISPDAGVVADDSGCSVGGPGRGAMPALVLLVLGACAAVRRKQARLAALAVLLLGAAGCSAGNPEGGDADEEQCEAPTLAQSAEALSSIDCGEHGDTGYSSGSPFPITVVTVDGKPVEKATANAYYVMAQAAAAAGVNLKIVSGFRTMAEQQYFYGCYVNCNCNNCNLAAKPGYSNHQSGHALDLNTSSAGVYAWLEAHAGAYGFKRTVPSENWHWEWWGGGPGGGPCGSCKPHCDGSKIVGADCGKGDCAAYGATCVDDAKGVRSASVFCPAQGQKKVCINDKLIGDCNDGAISSGDCSAYGAKCVDDAKGARCVSVFCPALGQKKVCLDDKLIGDCNDGAISAGDCSIYAAKCVDDAKGARCASLFCDDAPGKAHDVCLPNGQLGHCTDAGGLSAEDCPAGEPCTDTAAGAQCGETPAPAPSGGSGGSGAGGSGSGWTGGAGGGSSGGKPGASPSSGGKPGSSAEDVEAGCSCSMPGESAPRSLPAHLALAALALLGARRRAAL